MGFLRRDHDPDRALAAAIGKRGLPARARIESVREAGEGELELTLAFTTRDGAPVRAVVRQRFNHLTRVGMEAGEGAEIMYDREDPQRAVVLGSTRYKMVEGQLVEVVDRDRR